MPETETEAPLYEVLVFTPESYDPARHPYRTHSDALHYYAECKEQGYQALYVNREGDDPVVTGLMSDPIVAWTTAEMQQRFAVEGFSAGICVVRRKSDGQLGSLNFTPSPRFYYAWLEHTS